MYYVWVQPQGHQLPTLWVFPVGCSFQILLWLYGANLSVCGENPSNWLPFSASLFEDMQPIRAALCDEGLLPLSAHGVGSALICHPT